MRREQGNRQRNSGSRNGGFGNSFGNSYGDGNRGSRGGGQRRSFNDGPREMHKATCADCKAECEVPFKPSGERPVYCKDCFAKHKPPRF